MLLSLYPTPTDHAVTINQEEHLQPGASRAALLLLSREHVPVSSIKFVGQ